MSRSAAANALANETSPYLLQHAGNPVDWHPWGPEALERARRDDRPILLSIGYSACHWCHVMAHESFEDEETARVMNEHFVNIKVDREERPDLDKIYQLAHQLLTRRPGGWPLTMFLTPDDLTPFFGGTYFPVEPRHGMPAFKDLLLQVARLYRERREDIRNQNRSLVEALQQIEPGPAADDTLTSAPLEEARAELERSFDSRHGGFGGAPKFPHPSGIELLLRSYAASVQAGEPDHRALEMAERSLGAMARGGIYDQIGGGFCRYSVDEQWLIPHFEKMLYDNGPLLALSARLWQLSGDPLFERVARETGEWVLREMQSPEGGYYSTLDADSEGEEGRFYLWSRAEVEALLDEDEYRVAARRFGFDRPPNFEGSAWHARLQSDLAQVAKATSMDEARVRELADSARRKLFEARERRVRPGRDEKILTAWNGLMIRGMADAGRILDEPRFTRSAERALDFARARLWRDGRLLATCKDGRARLAAYLDDYAFLADGVLALLESRWRDGDLDFALALLGVLMEHFEDPRGGGFFFTADDHERLVHRPKSMLDESLPSGNGMAARLLQRLGHALGETRWLDAAERTLRAAWPVLRRVPHAHATLLLALEDHLQPPQTIILRGEGEALERWRRRCQRRYAPRRLTLAIPAQAAGLPGLLAERGPREGPVAWICEGFQCRAPITDPEALEAALAATEVAPRAAGARPPAREDPGSP